MKGSYYTLTLILVFTLTFMITDAQWDNWFKPTKKTPSAETTPATKTKPDAAKKSPEKAAPPKNYFGKAMESQTSQGGAAAPASNGAAAAPAKTGGAFVPDTATAPVKDTQRMAAMGGGSQSGQSGNDGQLVKADVLKKTGNIAEMLAHIGATSFLQLVQRNNLEEALKGTAEFTVFAPTNEALASLPKWGFRKVVADPKLLALMLTYHIAPGKIGLTNFTNGLKIPTSYYSRPLYLGIYPTPTRITVNHAQMIIPETVATNGVIHVINSAMFPVPDATIFGILEGCPSFSEIKKHIVKAGLDSLMKAEGSALTLFAPTNDAFAALPAKVKEVLEDNSTATESVAKVQALILHHIIQGTFFSSAFHDGEEVVMASGKEVWMGVRGDRLRDVSVARVLRPDISTINGVVHAIDRFLVYDELY